MVGTPEWKAANNYAPPVSNPTNPMARGSYVEAALPWTPAGTTLTTAQKQAQSPLYNPLYDPGSSEYQSNLLNTSKGYQSPGNTYQPSVTPPTTEVPAWQPPAQIPQQDQGALFQQNNQQGASVPAWIPPTLGPTQPEQMQNPGLGTAQSQMQTSRYQSPSSRYARNQMAF